MPKFMADIGLEVHAQLQTRTKLFCGCAARFGEEPNSHTCPACLGLPGGLPSPNRRAIELAVAAGFVLHAQVRRRSQFARKSYFYPDLAKGYQISQFALPIVEDGLLHVVGDQQATIAVRIERAHLEEDAAKNLHGVSGQTVVDFNRAGVPLLEIVSRPDLHSGEQAEAYLRQLRELLVFAEINDGNLERGSFRCDANVSVRRVGDSKLGTRVELKNINSFRFVRKAIDFEIARQKEVVRSGQAVVHETRHWNEELGQTESMRGKESAPDYRYFPDPDLPEVVVSEELIDSVRAALPPSAAAIRARWMHEHGLAASDAERLTSSPERARFFDAVLAQLAPELVKRAANFVLSEVAAHGAAAEIAPADVADILGLEAEGTINTKISKDVLAKCVELDERPRDLVKRLGLAQLTDTSAIRTVVAEVLAKHPRQVEQYRSGKEALLGFFVGQVMRETHGQANPKLVQQALREQLR